MNRYSNDTVGEWREYNYDDVYNTLKSTANKYTIEKLCQISDEYREKISELREEMISIIDSALQMAKMHT